MITQKSIDRVLKFLIFAQNRVIKNKDSRLHDLAREYRISAGVATVCYRLKYFEKADGCTFCSVNTFEPFHARKILETVQEYSRNRKVAKQQPKTFDELINDLHRIKEQLEQMGSAVSIKITTKQEIIL